jgi:large subunit ribosomal protein L13
MAELNIDATNLIVGRLGSYAAKQALLGHAVNIINCEKAVMTGTREFITEKYHYRIREVGQPQKGPFISRLPDRFLRRQIRGMLPHKKARGAAAWKRIMCYVGVPEEFKGKKLQTLDWANRKHRNTMKITTVQDICRAIGGKA